MKIFNTRQARKAGWIILDMPAERMHEIRFQHVTFYKLIDIIDENISGRVIYSVQPNYRFAFENTQDALWFKLKWL